MSTKNEKPNVEKWQEVHDWLEETFARVRREARAEAFEQAGWACLALSEGADQAVQCAKRIAELAAKERAK